MDCQTWREAVSARLDAESLPVPEHALEQHLAGCASCRDFEDSIVALRRATTIVAAADIPDMSAALTTIFAKPGVHSRHDGLRAVLAGIGVGEILTGVRLLAGTGTTRHLSRDLAGFALALGIGFLLTAYRPRLVAGVLPVAAILAASTTVIVLVDLFSGAATFGNEVHHLFELVALWVLWELRDKGSPILSIRGGLRV
jgi:predicted anti-sigma-YlaC factor YlaD